MRRFSTFDQVLIALDQGLKTLFAKPVAKRANPARAHAVTVLSAQQQRDIAALVRVNHAGEVCAQALYRGQAVFAREPAVAAALYQSAQEENDHLAWCGEQLQVLHSHTSYLNPFWYVGAYAIGLMAGWLGDGYSLGFIAETERQVVRHLDRHLQQLPADEQQNRAVFLAMCVDEAQHAGTAVQAGGVELPPLVRTTMTYTSKVMTSVAYWL